MAEIREELTVVDNFSNALSRFAGFIDNITGDLRLTNSEIFNAISGFGSLGGQSRQLADDLGRVAEPLSDIAESADGTKDIGKNIDDAGKKANNAANGGFDKLLKKVTQIATTFISLKGLSDLFGGALQDNAFEVRYQVRLQDDEVGSALYKWSNQFANDIGRSIDDVLESTNNFLAVTTNPRYIEELSTIADKFALIGNNDDYKGLANAISQAFRTGQVRTLSSQTGISSAVFENAGVKDAAKANDLGAYLEGLREALDLIGLTDEAYEKLLNSSNVLWRRFKQNVVNNVKLAAQSFTQALNPALQRFNEWIESDNAKRFFQELAVIFELFGNIAAIALDKIVDGLDFLSENFDILVGVALTAFGLIAASVGALAAGFIIANIEIIAVIGVILFLINIALQLGATFEDVFSTIGKIITAVLVTAYNEFVKFYNLVVGIVEGILIAFNNLPAGIAIIFESIVQIALSAVEQIASFLDHVLGGNLAVTVKRFRKGLHSEVKKQYGLEDDDRFERLELLDLNDQLTKWGDIFGSVGKKIDEFDPNAFTDGFKDVLDNYEGFDQIGDIDSIGKVGSVGKVKDVSIKEEDIRKILDLIDRRNQVIINLESVTPDNTINVYAGSDMDSGMVNDITDRIEQIINEQRVGVSQLNYNY